MIPKQTEKCVEMSEYITYRTEAGKMYWILLITTIVVISIIIMFLIIRFNISFPALAASAALILIIVMVAIPYGYKYTFEQDRLVVRTPFVINIMIIILTQYSFDTTKYILYSEVKKIVIRSDWPVAGASSNCVGIYHGKNNYSGISPKNREEFVKTLRERCPQAAFETKIK